MTDKLKPCPFCGGSDIDIRTDDCGLSWYSFCNDCGVMCGYSTTKDDVMNAWNRRAERIDSDDFCKRGERREALKIIRCEDCQHANECHKSVQYTRIEPNTVTIGYSPIEWCSRGERREALKK